MTVILYKKWENVNRSYDIEEKYKIKSVDLFSFDFIQEL